MRLRLGTVRRALIVAPHPDDEAIGAWGLMSQLVRRGARVSILVVTDGCASHPASARWPRERLRRERRRETLRAVRLAGVPAGHLRFLDLPDGGLAAHRHARRHIAAAAARVRADLLVGPLGDDDHPDHRVVADALRYLPGAGVRRLGYPVWPIGRRTASARSLILGSALHATKRRAVRSYRTQTGWITDDAAGFSLSAKQIAAFPRPAELFVERRR